MEVLYKVSVSTGKMQVWKAWTNKELIICSYGQLGGKMQESEVTAEAKNVGRSNATTAEEQAEVELKALYKAQCDNKHYRYTQEEAQAFSDSNKEPRKILDYKKGWKKMSPILLTSVKENGSRACVLEGVCHSKIGKPEEIKVPHLRAVVDELGELAHFDAEVYADGLSLQRVRSAWIKPNKTDKDIITMAKKRAKERGEEVPTPDGNIELQDAIKYLGYCPRNDVTLLRFNIFDIPDTTGKPFTERVACIKRFRDLVESKGLGVYFEYLLPVPTHSHEERIQMVEKVTAQGKEGLVHYEPEGIYEFGKRSSNAQKSKLRFDGEALVLSVVKDKKGNGTLECVAADVLDNVKFKCVMKVDRRDGKSYSKSYESMLELVGKWITFSYEELSDKGIPTKPVGELERDCDDSGDPLN